MDVGGVREKGMQIIRITNAIWTIFRTVGRRTVLPLVMRPLWHDSQPHIFNSENHAAENKDPISIIANWRLIIMI